MSPFIAFLAFLLTVAAACIAIVFILVPVLQGVGWVLTGIGNAIVWLVSHIVEYISGTISDVLRFLGALICSIVLLPMVPINVIIGRWSAAGHFSRAVRREASVAAHCVYRVLLRRPLKLVMLHGLLEGLEQRVPEVIAGAPASDKPKKRSGQFRGYTIVGSLKGGGSGAKLYIAEPDPNHHRRSMPELVVIKSFTLEEGSSLPQIVRESRALEGARQIGVVLDHEMTNERFFYVMPYHPGEHLGVVTRHLHGETEGRGLEPRQLSLVMSYSRDLLATLKSYHDAGLWHKDVKPDNVIVDGDEAHLVDLGLVTPLRSAMTLTTHGTEYFRDPELVRQALRGVKVHQVDGTRFDVYAVGAVLYFMLENTFPAHGGLSRFSRKSPEALRWIVRRAMAEYNQRYDSAQAMLDDLLVVAAANDAYDVKPAQLPSMSGKAAPTIEDLGGESLVDDAPSTHDAPAAAFVASTPRPEAYAAHETVDPSTARAEAAAMGAGERPTLRVTNWWTGAYTVEKAPQATSLTEQARQAAAQLREQAEYLRQTATVPQEKAKKAGEQARERASEMRDRAKARMASAKTRCRTSRRKTSCAKPPMFLIGFLCFLAVAIGGTATMLLVMGERVNDVTANLLRSRDANQARIVYRGSTFAPAMQRPLALINFHPAGQHDRVRAEIRDIVDAYERDDFTVIDEPFDGLVELEQAYAAWYATDQSHAADEALEALLAEHQLYGLLVITDDDDDVRPQDRGVHGQLIYSEAHDASSRRGPGTSINTLAGQFLLINDHPLGVQRSVKNDIAGLLDRLDRETDVSVIRDPAKEARLRPHFFATGTEVLDDDVLLERKERLSADLHALELTGVLYVAASSSSVDDVIMHIITANEPTIELIDGDRGTPPTLNLAQPTFVPSTRTISRFAAPSPSKHSSGTIVFTSTHATSPDAERDACASSR